MEEGGAPRRGDEYEASMAAPGEALHRDKLVSRSLALVSLGMTLFTFVAAAGAGLTEGAPLAAVLGVGSVGLATAFIGLTRSVLRTVVTKDELRIQWGLWGPTIPLAAVSAVSVRHDCSRVAMNEAMRAPGSAPVQMMGPISRTPVVDIEWTDEKGKARRAWLGASDAEALAAAIRRGMARGRARVEVDEREEVEEEVAVEALRKQQS